MQLRYMKDLFKKFTIAMIFVVSILPLTLLAVKTNNLQAVAYPIDLHYWYSLDWASKLNILVLIYTIGAYTVAAIGVIVYINNTNKYISPEILIEIRKKKITIFASQIPFTKDLTFFLNNNGNVSIEKEAINYTLLIPNEINVQLLPIQTTDNGN